MDIGILETCGIVAAISGGLGGPIAVIKWCNGFVSGKITECEKQLQASIGQQGHKLNNAVQRIDAMERLRNADIERIVKVETNLTNLEKGQERIEHQIDRNHREAMDHTRALFDQVADSLREAREVKLKG